MISFQDINFLSFSDKEWNIIHQYRRKIHLQDTPEEPIMDDRSFEEQIKGQLSLPGIDAFTYLIRDEEKLIGLFFFYFYNEQAPAYKTNEKLVMFQIEMLKEYRRRGVGTQAIRNLIEICEKKNKFVFIAMSKIPETNNFFDAIGAKIAQKHVENKLKLSEIDWKMIDQWLVEGQQINPKTKILTLKGSIPDEYIDNFMKTFNETANLQPKDDLEIGDMTMTKEDYKKIEKSEEKGNIITLTIMTVEENGEVSGLTQLRRIPGREKLLSQNLTGVPIKYRGRKLGKWVKAAMLKYVKENYPDTEAITTGNAESNDAMLHINKKLGFKKYKEEVLAQVTLEQLKNYLNSKVEPNIKTN